MIGWGLCEVVVVVAVGGPTTTDPTDESMHTPLTQTRKMSLILRKMEASFNAWLAAPALYPLPCALAAPRSSSSIASRYTSNRSRDGGTGKPWPRSAARSARRASRTEDSMASSSLCALESLRKGGLSPTL